MIALAIATPSCSILSSANLRSFGLSMKNGSVITVGATVHLRIPPPRSSPDNGLIPLFGRFKTLTIAS